METKGNLPPDANWLTPYLTVADAERSLAFYERAFGFARGNVLPGPKGGIMHADMTYQGKTVIMFAPESTPSPVPMKTPAHSGVAPPISLYVYCPDVDALAEQARRVDATVLEGPEDMFWGDRMVSLRDPDGYIWSFATRVGEFDPSKMPK
ncbi:MAG: VOC family protein [Desulfuromonadales bacterium]|nr:VOC family protein [Desulfuromonadales bacterium]